MLLPLCRMKVPTSNFAASAFSCTQYNALFEISAVKLMALCRVVANVNRDNIQLIN